MNRLLSAGWAYALAFLLAADALAQTPTQPVYVRQAKNAVVQVYDNATGATGASTKIWDTTAFASAIVTFVRVSGTCGPTYEVWEVPRVFGYMRFNTGQSITNTDIFVEFAPMTTGTPSFISGYAPNAVHTFSSSAANCTFDLYLTLIPISDSVTALGERLNGSEFQSEEMFPTLIGGANFGTNPATVQMLNVNASGNITPATPTGAATAIAPNSITTVETVYSFDGTKRVTLQNNGTGALLCAVTSNASLAVDTTNYDFSLAAATAANDGTGGSITLPYIPLTAYYLRCVALSGTGIAAGFAHL